VRASNLTSVLGLGACVFVAAAVAAFFALGPVARAHQPRTIHAIDGDTLEDPATRVTYRLANIDTPEVGRNARCSAERALGERATRRVRTLLANAERIETRSTGRIDSYGRDVAYVLVDGRDLGDALVREGLARPWRGRREPWCDSTGRLIP